MHLMCKACSESHACREQLAESSGHDNRGFRDGATKHGGDIRLQSHVTPSRRQYKDERGVACGVVVAGLNGKGFRLHKALPKGLCHKAGQRRNELVRTQHAQRDNLLQGGEVASPGLWQGCVVWLQAVINFLPGHTVDCKGIWQTLQSAQPDFSSSLRIQKIII